jgi:hypothetical protein
MGFLKPSVYTMVSTSIHVTALLLQMMMLLIWKCMETATRSAKSLADSSYHYQLLTYLQSDEMENQIGLMPVGMRDRLCCCIVAQSLSQFLLETWIPETLQLIGAQLEGPDEMTATGVCSAKSDKKEVNRFFGGGQSIA